MWYATFSQPVAPGHTLSSAGPQTLRICQNPLACWDYVSPRNSPVLAQVDALDIVPTEDGQATTSQLTVVSLIEPHLLVHFADDSHACANQEQSIEAGDYQRVHVFDLGVVLAGDQAHCRVYDQSVVYAHDRCVVECYDRATVVAYGSTRVYAHDMTHVILCDDAQVTTYSRDVRVDRIGDASLPKDLYAFAGSLHHRQLQEQIAREYEQFIRPDSATRWDNGPLPLSGSRAEGLPANKPRSPRKPIAPLRDAGHPQPAGAVPSLNAFLSEQSA